YERGPFELTDSDITKMKEILSNTNIKVCGIAAPFYKCDIDNEEEIAQNIEGLKHCIDIAKQLDTNIIRGFTFWDKGNFIGNLDKIASKFEQPIQLLKQANMILALEFDPTVYATNAKKLKMVIDKINSPYVKALWDPGNDIYDPQGEEPYPYGYEILKQDICHIHLKDAKRINGVTISTPMCEGDVDYKGQFNRLIDDKYEGYISLETHYRGETALSEELLQLPKGSVFSYKGLEASTQSLENLMGLLNNL
ncbi:MAG: sugar phosphate isomerase/epimerase family protein, partial [Niameybacter sp.]